MPTTYPGPERRSPITFTRADSDRLVRLEEKLIDNGSKMDDVIEAMKKANDKNDSNDHRIQAVERRMSWMTGLGAGFAFIISGVIAWFKGHG